jgi:hypothetical protein
MFKVIFYANYLKYITSINIKYYNKRAGRIIYWNERVDAAHQRIKIPGTSLFPLTFDKFLHPIN